MPQLTHKSCAAPATRAVVVFLYAMYRTLSVCQYYCCFVLVCCGCCNKMTHISFIQPISRIELCGESDIDLMKVICAAVPPATTAHAGRFECQEYG